MGGQAQKAGLLEGPIPMRPIQFRPAFVLALVSSVAGTAASAQIVLTESFELPDTANFQSFVSGQTIVTATHSWSVTATGVDLFEDAARSEATAFDGAQAIDLAGSPGAGVIQTSFATLPGATYALSFHYARNNNIGGATADAQVDVVGSTSRLHATVQHVPANEAFGTFRTFEQAFVADSATTILRFTSLEAGNAGIVLDAIQVEQLVASVPSFGSVTRGLLLLAALGVATASIVRASWGRVPAR